VAGPADLARSLGATGYLADTGVATAAYLALALPRPLFLEGEAGVGKTSLARSLARLLGAPLVRLQCYEGIDASQALYDWDFPRQLLHLRAAEAAGAGARGPGVEEAVARLEDEVYSRRFLLARPLLQALETSPSVLLVDEVDRADDEFEAFLLEVLSTYQVTIPELGTVRAATPPYVVLTSNRTRELHDALKRRCLYHWIDHPSLEREVAIVRSRAPEVSATLAAQVVAVVQRLRDGGDLLKPPGVAETLDWARALHHLGTVELDLETAALTLGALVKYREDADRVRGALDRMLA
jgi:MoxR-like ATPase